MRELLLWLFGAFCGWIFSNVMDYVAKTLRRKYEIKKNREMMKSSQEKQHKDILLLDQGVPFFLPENVRAHYNEENKFFIEFPKEMLGRFEYLSNNELKAFTRSSESFCNIRLAEIPEEELFEIIEKSRIRIARKFVERSEGMLFNNLLFGVIRSYSNSRTPDTREKMIYNIDLFETDYYTHRVVEDILDSIDSLTIDISKKQLNTILSWTRTSFGLSIILRIPASEEILMTVRSRETAYAQGRDLYYVSATETFSLTDYNYNGVPSLLKCLVRGLEEELGIPEYMLDMSSVRFLDAFYETHFHQDGFVATIDLKGEYTFADIVDLRAKDKTLEIKKMCLLPDTRVSLQKFINESIKNNMSNVQAQTLFALESYLARHNRD